jgi:hypothetical protein
MKVMLMCKAHRRTLVFSKDVDVEAIIDDVLSTH